MKLLTKMLATALLLFPTVAENAMCSGTEDISRQGIQAVSNETTTNNTSFYDAKRCEAQQNTQHIGSITQNPGLPENIHQLFDRCRAELSTDEQRQKITDFENLLSNPDECRQFVEQLIFLVSFLNPMNILSRGSMFPPSFFRQSLILELGANGEMRVRDIFDRIKQQHSTVKNTGNKK